MELYSEAIMYICLGGLIASGVGIFVLKVAVPAWDQIRKFFALPRIQQALLAAFVVGMYVYGSNKPTPTPTRITFDGGIKQNPLQPSIVSNNLFEVHWMRDLSGGIYVPESATVYIDYKPWADTNAEWQVLAETTVGQWHYATMLANATNYAYNVWAYYIPPEPVHTNCVWLYKTLKDRNEAYPLPLRARIEVNGKAISTPAQKRKDEWNE